MIAAGPFRWLLTLAAMIAPFAAVTGRVRDTSADRLIQQASADHVVFRHYL
ncbi:hypothetical protein G3T14_23550 [Methylobacterium sp. BTF04]|uniref:hypothetical protein n=1 Tax=Methylobacterium sp. BTF04 TaxID=2708300 RepID=UPI0013D6310E|nr:hypothetical protein [Methylobacterium sp. BTF04]NEU15022.1 hypothetical protein [Methylobacterium sp. BTF04]